MALKQKPKVESKILAVKKLILGNDMNVIHNKFKNLELKVQKLDKSSKRYSDESIGNLKKYFQKHLKDQQKQLSFIKSELLKMDDKKMSKKKMRKTLKRLIKEI